MVSKNKQIHKTVSDGIQFKSRLEKEVYDTMCLLGLKPKYEPETFVLYDGFVPKTPFYDRKSKKRGSTLILKKGKVQGIRYTPDFRFRKYGYDVYVEAKGYENDVFYIKKKLFRKYLDDKYLKDGTKSLYFEVYNKGQVVEMFEIVKTYK